MTIENIEIDQSCIPDYILDDVFSAVCGELHKRYGDRLDTCSFTIYAKANIKGD